MDASEEQSRFAVRRRTRNGLILLYLLGFVHWIVFFYLVFPGDGNSLSGGDRLFVNLVWSPAEWFEIREFNAHDWYKELNYHQVIQEALRTGTVPFHVPELGRMFMVRGHFLGAPMWTMSPQVVLLYFLDPLTFAVVNLLLMYSIGFYGCLLLRKLYGIGLLPFAFLFLLFNFNGCFVAKVTAYGPGQLGYFLIPFALYALFCASDLKIPDYRGQFHWGIVLGIVLAAILYQGSIKFFIHYMTFVLVWGAVNYRLWRMSILSLSMACAIGMLRLLPAAVTFGLDPNPHHTGWGGFFLPEVILKALVLTQTHLSPPHFAWWEFSLYIGLIGLLALVYFGMWGSFMRFDWAQFPHWRTMAAPCLVMVFLSVGRVRDYVVPLWIPLLSAEPKYYAYIFVSVLVVTVSAAVNLHGFMQKYWHRKRVKYALSSGLVLTALSLLNHSRLWRLHRVQKEFDWVIANKVFPGEEPSPQVVLHIVNNPGDTLYIASFWAGLAVSCLAFAIAIGWLWVHRGAYRHQWQPFVSE